MVAVADRIFQAFQHQNDGAFPTAVPYTTVIEWVTPSGTTDHPKVAQTDGLVRP
jgi:hypothetical protein